MYDNSPRSSLLISGSKKVIKVWNLKTSTDTATINAHESWVDCCCVLSPTRVASASDNTIKIFDIVKGKCLMTLKQHCDDINSLISISKKYLCSSSDDQTIKLWDLTQGKCIKSWNCNAGGVKCLLHLPNLIEGKDIIACGADDGSVKLWDVEGTDTPFCVLVGHNSTVWCIIQKSVENGSGQILSASDDHSIRLWDLKTRKCIKWLQEHEGAVFSLSLLSGREGTAKATYFASGSADQTIKIWDLKRGQCLHTITKGHSKNINTLLLVGRNQLASASNDKTIKIWNINFNDPNTIETTESTTSNPVTEKGAKRGLINITLGKILKGHTHGIFALSLFANDEKEKIQKEKIRNQFERLVFLKNNQEKKLNDSFYIQFGALPHDHEEPSGELTSENEPSTPTSKKKFEDLSLPNVSIGNHEERPVSMIRIFKSLLVQSSIDFSGKECVIFSNIRYPLDVDEFYIWCMLFGMMDIEDDSGSFDDVVGSPSNSPGKPLKRRMGRRMSRRNEVEEGLDPICYFDLFVFFQTLNMKNYMYIICKILQRELSVSKMREDDLLDTGLQNKQEKWGSKRERFRVLFLLFLKSLKLFERGKKRVITEEYLHDHINTPATPGKKRNLRQKYVFENEILASQNNLVDEDDDEENQKSSHEKYEQQLVQLFETNTDSEDDEEIFDCKFKSVFTLNLFNILKTHYTEIVQNRRYVYFLDHFDYLAKLQFFEITPIEKHGDFRECDFSILKKKSYSKRRNRSGGRTRQFSIKEEVSKETKEASINTGENDINNNNTNGEKIMKSPLEDKKDDDSELPFTLKDLFEMNLRKLYETKKYANLFLKTKKDGKTFRLHKEVLIFKSNFFYRMFKFPGLESQSIMNFGKNKKKNNNNNKNEEERVKKTTKTNGDQNNVQGRVRDDDEGKQEEKEEEEYNKNNEKEKEGEIIVIEEEKEEKEEIDEIIEEEINEEEEEELPVVEIEFLKSNELFFLIQFIYLGEITSNDLGVSFRLLEHAEMYFEKELKEYLINKINHIFHKSHSQNKFEAEMTNYGYYVSNLPEKLQEQFFETWVMNFKTSREVISNMIRHSEKMHKSINSLLSEKENLKNENKDLNSSLEMSKKKMSEMEERLQEYMLLLKKNNINPEKLK